MSAALAAKAVHPRIFAKEAFEAAVFTRGPSEWFHVIRWDTRHDKFDSGAWIRGKIYP